jgi:large subunit ribosomal protein L25
MASNRPTIDVQPRDEFGSRESRRLRRSGRVPGVVYGTPDGSCITFAADARELRRVLVGAGALIDLKVDGDARPVIVKDTQLHPVRGDLLHVDFLQVRLDEKIQTTVPLHAEGGDDAPGVKEGGVLEQVTRELTVEALPTEIPDSLQHDVSALVIGDTVTLDALNAPANVKLVDDPETVIATLTPPKLQLEEEPELEEETELVGEGEEAAEGEAAADGAEGAAEGGDADSGE